MTPRWPWLRPSHWHRQSVRRTLLTLVLPVMLSTVGIELALTWGTALQAANSAYDRSLLGAIKAIDVNVSTETGGLSVELPYRMLEFFELTASGQVYFRVSTEDGLVEIGNAGLPLPPERLQTGVPRFIDAEYFGAPVRVGAWARELDADKKQLVAHEMADVLLYLVQLSSALGVDLMAAAREKMAINESRYPVDRAKGSSRKHDELG